jgi:hypothetical protein
MRLQVKGGTLGDPQNSRYPTRQWTRIQSATLKVQQAAPINQVSIALTHDVPSSRVRRKKFRWSVWFSRLLCTSIMGRDHGEVRPRIRHRSRSLTSRDAPSFWNMRYDLSEGWWGMNRRKYLRSNVFALCLILWSHGGLGGSCFIHVIV